MRYLLALFSILLFITSCSKRPAEPPIENLGDITKPIHCREVSKIAYSLEKELLDTEGDFHLCKAFLCDHEEDNVLERTIIIEYYSQEILELEEGRDLIVHMTEYVIGKVNKHPFLFRTMPQAPIDASHLNLIIEFESYYGKYVDPLYLGRIELRDGIVRYYANTALDFQTIVFQRHIEDYTTARMITQVKQEVEMEHKNLKVKPVRKRSRGPIPPPLIKGPSFLRSVSP